MRTPGAQMTEPITVDGRKLAIPTPEQAAMVNDHPEMVRFMHNHVVPDIQAILGADPYDPVAQTGFSCFSCHPHGG